MIFGSGISLVQSTSGKAGAFPTSARRAATRLRAGVAREPARLDPGASPAAPRRRPWRQSPAGALGRAARAPALRIPTTRTTRTPPNRRAEPSRRTATPQNRRAPRTARQAQTQKFLRGSFGVGRMPVPHAGVPRYGLRSPHNGDLQNGKEPIYRQKRGACA